MKKYRYIGYYTTDPFNETKIFTFTGEVEAVSMPQAYDIASDELWKQNSERIQRAEDEGVVVTFYFLNWFVQEKKVESAE